jgi:hypothetical protein
MIDIKVGQYLFKVKLKYPKDKHYKDFEGHRWFRYDQEPTYEIVKIQCVGKVTMLVEGETDPSEHYEDHLQFKEDKVVWAESVNNLPKYLYLTEEEAILSVKKLNDRYTSTSS